MRKVLIIILIILLLSLGGVVLMFSIKKKVDIVNITKLHLSYSTSTMMNGNVIYEIELKNDKYMLHIKPNMLPEEEAIDTEISKEDILKIEEIFNKYEVYKWDGFQKSDKYVLDGNSFSFWVYFNEDKDIHASGYMMYPKNYGNVETELESIFEKYNSVRE